VSGDTIVVELPDQKFVAFQSLEPTSDDNLIDELIANNAGFRDMIARSKSGRRKPFVDVGEDNA